MKHDSYLIDEPQDPAYWREDSDHSAVFERPRLTAPPSHPLASNDNHLAATPPSPFVHDHLDTFLSLLSACLLGSPDAVAGRSS